MGATPRFALGDHVVTTRHGPGEVVLIYPPARGRVTYGISVATQRPAVIYDERELVAAPHVPEGRTVRCADCAHGHKSNYLLNAVRCAAYHRAKSANSQRLCPRFKARDAGTPAPTLPLHQPET